MGEQPYELRLYVSKRPGHFISADMEKVDGHWIFVCDNHGLVGRIEAMGHACKSDCMKTFKDSQQKLSRR